MIKNSIEQLANCIGFDIGASDNVVQVDLINGLSRGLKSSIRNDHDLDMQLCFVVEKLDNNSKKIIKALNEFIELSEND